jgi:hypothetical protein
MLHVKLATASESFQNVSSSYAGTWEWHLTQQNYIREFI